MDTIFDKILRKEIPADIVYEDEDVMAINDINPQAPVHILVLPKTRCTGIEDINTLNTVDTGNYIKKLAIVAEIAGIHESGYRIVFNSGNHGQQTVKYIHAHILGGRQMNWPPG